MTHKRCGKCGGKLIGKNTIVVGYCRKCYLDIVRKEYNGDEDSGFVRCAECDGHDACEDFGCAIIHGLGHMVKPDNGMI
jgi:hypothetical protein